jgi:hypothetical protein
VCAPGTAFQFRRRQVAPQALILNAATRPNRDYKSPQTSKFIRTPDVIKPSYTPLVACEWDAAAESDGFFSVTMSDMIYCRDGGGFVFIWFLVVKKAKLAAFRLKIAEYDFDVPDTYPPGKGFQE